MTLPPRDPPAHAPGVGDEPLLINACCLDCGYSLHALQSKTCPECGREYEPGDSSTFGIGGLSGSIERGLRRPPGLPHVILASLALVLLLDASSRFFADGTTLQVACAFLVLLAGLNECIIRRLVVRSRGPHRHEARRSWRWYVTPLAWVIAGTLMVSDWPVHARFALSRSAFERAVAEFRLGRRRTGWIGLYHVESMTLGTKGVEFVTDDFGSGEKGFLYATGRSVGGDPRIDLGGPWSGGGL